MPEKWKLKYPRARFWREGNVTMTEIVQAADVASPMRGDGDVVKREARPEDREEYPEAWQEFMQSQQPKRRPTP